MIGVLGVLALLLACSDAQSVKGEAAAGGAAGAGVAAEPSTAPASPVLGSAQQPLVEQAVTLKAVPLQHLQAVQQGLAERLSHSSDGLQFSRAPNGALRVNLQGRFQHVMIVNQDTQGRAHIACVDSQEGVAAALGHPGATP